MLRVTLLLALAAATCCSAIHFNIPESVLSYQAANLDQVGRRFYFPCDDVTARHVEDLDLGRFNGRWYQVNGAFAVSDKINPDNVQAQISTMIGCMKDHFTSSSTSNQIGITADVITRQPVPANATLPPNGKLINPNDIQFTSNAVLERRGDNGLWWSATDIGNNNTLIQDVSVVSTDYTSYAILYICQDVPVPGTADTKREQQWSIVRRRPRNLNPIQLIAAKLLALRNGIVDADRLYTYPTDMCRSRPRTTTTSTTSTTTTPTTTTSTTTTTPTTTTSTTTTTPTTPTTTTSTTSTTTHHTTTHLATDPTPAPRPTPPATSFYQTLLKSVRSFHW